MNNSILLLCMVSLVASIAGCKQTENAGNPSDISSSIGHFEGEVVASWDNDGRKMTLREDFSYVDPNSRRWLAPAGSVVDGASIPPAFWTFVGGPFEGQYRKASVVHDVGCVEKTATWEDVHRMFYDACLAGGVDEKTAKVLYYAVYHFGPRWEPVIETVVETHENEQGLIVQERVKRRRMRCHNPEPPTSDEIQQVFDLVVDDNPRPVELEQMTREELRHRPHRRRNSDGHRRRSADDFAFSQNQDPAKRSRDRVTTERQTIDSLTKNELPQYDQRSGQTVAPNRRSSQSINRTGGRDESRELLVVTEDEKQWIARQVQSHLVNRLRQPEPDTYDVARTKDGYRVRAWFYEHDRQGQPIEDSRFNFNLTARVSAAGEVLEIVR